MALIRIPAEESGVIRLSDPLIRNRLRPPMVPWFSIMREFPPTKSTTVTALRDQNPTERQIIWFDNLIHWFYLVFEIASFALGKI